MTEKAVLALLARAVQQIADDHGMTDLAASTDASEAIAEACWTALVVLLRETLMGDEIVTIDDLGVFEVPKEDPRIPWRFSASEPLLEARSMAESPDEGYLGLIHAALFFIQEATSLVDRVADQVPGVPPSPRVYSGTEEEALVIEVFGASHSGARSFFDLLISDLSRFFRQVEALRDRILNIPALETLHSEISTGVVAGRYDAETLFGSDRDGRPRPDDS
jgi:nucleoid DNA-binding protein